MQGLSSMVETRDILPEGRGHGIPESQDQRHAGVGFLSTRERPHVPADVEASSLGVRVGVDLDVENRVLVVKLELADVSSDAEQSGEVPIDILTGI